LGAGNDPAQILGRKKLCYNGARDALWENYLKNAAYKVWDLASELLGKPITKNNLRSILEEYILTPQQEKLILVFNRQQTQDKHKAKLQPPEFLEFPGRPVPLKSQFYVELTPIESRIYQEISQPGALLDIIAPWKMGKTSLMLRVLERARNLDYRAIVVNLQQADSTLFVNLDKFLMWFCASIARKLQLPLPAGDYDWSKYYGSKSNCTAFLQDDLLASSDTPVLLVIEEMDAIFSHREIADDFFALLYSWYEEGTYGDSNSTIWEKLRLVLVSGTELYVPADVNRSPLQMGLTIELQRFTKAQVDELAERHGLHLSSQQLEQLNQLLAGHPYLVRLTLYHIAQDCITIEEMVSTATTDASIYQHHLHQLLGHLQQHPVLAAAFAEVLSSPTPIKLELKLASQLHTLALVDIKDNGVTASCELYRQYFQNMF